jgi:DNA-binding Lrp family transcriptional regulator
MRLLDQQERDIIRQIIRNPRISDNSIAKVTKIPVTSVNRKRKILEQEGLINYYASIKKHEDGLEIFNVRQLYIIKLKAGITRNVYLQQIEADPASKLFNCTYISSTFLGEKDGHLAVIVIVDAANDFKLMEEFNGKIISVLKKKLGEDAIEEVTTARINDTVRLHHNYLPHLNMKEGAIRDDWPDEFIFVDKDPKKDHDLLDTEW